MVSFIHYGDRACARLAAVFAMDVVRHDADLQRRPLEPVAMRERALDVVEAALPVVAHRGEAKLVVLGRPSYALSW